LLVGLTLGALIAPVLAAGAAFDPQRSEVGFQMRTRWGQRVVGTFPRFDGELRELDDGRRQVRVEFDTAAVQMRGSPRYTAIARGPRFFDAARHPRATFVSEPYSPEMLTRGGALRGTLTLRGVSREETFELAPAACAAPGRDCDVVAHGQVRREDYGLDALQWVLQGRVHFTLRVRLAGS
jgi:polyisoprenoid-binding protein YceI